MPYIFIAIVLLFALIIFVIAVVIIVGVAMLTSGFVGRRIMGLDPVKMITEE